jgi:hypothetical protein
MREPTNFREFCEVTGGAILLGMTLALGLFGLFIFSDLARAQLPMPSISFVEGAAGCAAATTAIGRLTSPDSLHQTLYTNAICSLVASGTWAKLDALYILATNSSTNALINLKSTSFSPAVAHGTITFSADHGYTGDGSTGYLASGYTPSTAGGNMTLNSAAIGAYILTQRITGENYTEIGAGSPALDIVPWNGSDGLTYGEVNANSSGVTPSFASGLTIANRTASGTSTIWRNTQPYATLTQASSSLPTVALYMAGKNQAGSLSNPSTDQLAAAFIGGGLTTADQTALANAINGFLAGLATPVATFGKAFGNYSFLYVPVISGRGPPTALGTNDGHTFSGPLTFNCYNASNGTYTVELLLNSQDGVLYAIANPKNTSGSGAQQLFLDLYSVAFTNGMACTHIAQVSFTDAIGSGASAAVWPGSIFQDPYDNSIYLVNGASSNQASDTGFAPYYKKATSISAGTFGTTTAITGTSLPANLIDPFVYYEASSGNYYIWIKDETTKYVDVLECTGSATGFLGCNGNWTVAKSGNWAGWGEPQEAPQVFVNGSNYEVLLDAQGGGISYATAPTSGGMLGTWSANAAVTAPFTPQHGGIIPAPSGYSD